MTIKLDRAALADAMRSSPEFRALTRRIERKAVEQAVHVANSVVKRRTGQYVENFETTVTPVHQTETLARLRLFNTAPHGIFIEEGTSPHVIRPRRASILAFDVGGRRVFARQVHHPGTRAHHVIREALLRLVRSGV